jgi:hypothetical protein
MQWIVFLPKGEDLSRWISVTTHIFQMDHIQFSSWHLFSSFLGPKLPRMF